MLGDADMRRPGRVAQPQGGAAVDLLHHLVELADRSGPARGLDRRHPVSRHGVAEYKFAHAVAKLLVAAETLVGLRGLTFVKNLLRFLHRRHDRRIARGVLEDTNAKIDLAVARVGSEKLTEAEDGIRWNRLEFLEHRGSFHLQKARFLFRAFGRALASPSPNRQQSALHFRNQAARRKAQHQQQNEAHRQ